MDIVNIARGILNATRAEFGVADPKVEEKAFGRYCTCVQCPTISEDQNWCDKDKGGCGCKLGWLLRSNKKCVKGHWS